MSVAGAIAGAIGMQALNFGSSIGSAAGQYYFDKKAAERNFQYSKDLADYENNLNLINQARAWELYNSPSAQVRNLRKAGLNPNLAYGNGINASMPSVQTGVHPASLMSGSAGHNLQFQATLLDDYLKIRNFEVMKENKEHQNDLTDAKRDESFWSSFVKEQTGKDKEIANKYANSYYSGRAEGAIANFEYNQVKKAKEEFELSLDQKYRDEERLLGLEQTKENIKNSKMDRKSKRKQIEFVDAQMNDLKLKQAFYPIQKQLIFSQMKAANGSAAASFAAAALSRTRNIGEGYNNYQKYYNLLGFDNYADYHAYIMSRTKGPTWNPNYKSGYFLRRALQDKSLRNSNGRFSVNFMGSGVSFGGL